jgi:hypothetical protein
LYPSSSFLPPARPQRQSLHAITGVALSHARGLEEGAESDTTGAFFIREQSCPSEYTDYLGDDDED